MTEQLTLPNLLWAPLFFYIKLSFLTPYLGRLKYLLFIYKVDFKSSYRFKIKLMEGI